ncbi:MAG: DNA-3-methyladenine glycosylase I [marine bacterium B5-7]|nr:MAG: DNA-3-methyladenine glycosylase I [marine bacterium B5-7]
MSWYCDYAIGDPLHGSYHDTEYGFEITDESMLFERLVLEINQAGLNWGLILKKRPAFVSAFEGFDVSRIARYDDNDRKRLLNDAAIIRNRLKIDAVIHNAGVVESMRDSHGGFDSWLRQHHPMIKPDWVKLFKKTFKFTGGEITGEFLMSTGFLPGTHRPDCPVYKIIERTCPPWSEASVGFYTTD